MNFLDEWYERFTYGREWVVANVDTKQIAIPWQWIVHLKDEQMIEELNKGQLWEKADPIMMSEVGISPGSHCAIWDARRLKVMGIFLNDTDLLRKIIQSSNSISEIEILIQKSMLTTTSLSDEVLSQYQYKIVIAAHNSDYDNRAIVEI